MHVYAYAGHSRLIGPSGKWKVLDCAFITAGGQQAGIASIEEVATPEFGSTTLVYTQGGNFFGMVQLEGGQYQNGHAVTVTFEESVDMETVQVDLTSFNTHVVQQEDHDCVAETGQPCQALPALYFGGDKAKYFTSNSSGYGIVVFAGSESPYDLYTYAQNTSVTQVSIGFTSGAGLVDAWSYDTSYGTWSVAGPGTDGFGIWQPSGGTVPTRTKLATITVPDGTTNIGSYIDVDHDNSNMEDVQPVGSPLKQYSPLVYVYGAPKPTFYNPCASCASAENFQNTNLPCAPVQANGETYCALENDPTKRCYLEPYPCFTGDPGAGGSPACDSYAKVRNTSSPEFIGSLIELCDPKGDVCNINSHFGDCYAGESLCRPTTCYVPE